MPTLTDPVDATQWHDVDPSPVDATQWHDMEVPAAPDPYWAHVAADDAKDASYSPVAAKVAGAAETGANVIKGVKSAINYYTAGLAAPILAKDPATPEKFEGLRQSMSAHPAPIEESWAKVNPHDDAQMEDFTRRLAGRWNKGDAVQNFLANGQGQDVYGNPTLLTPDHPAVGLAKKGWGNLTPDEKRQLVNGMTAATAGAGELYKDPQSRAIPGEVDTGALATARDKFAQGGLSTAHMLGIKPETWGGTVAQQAFEEQQARQSAAHPAIATAAGVAGAIVDPIARGAAKAASPYLIPETGILGAARAGGAAGAGRVLGSLQSSAINNAIINTGFHAVGSTLEGQPLTREGLQEAAFSGAWQGPVFHSTLGAAIEAVNAKLSRNETLTPDEEIVRGLQERFGNDPAAIEQALKENENHAWPVHPVHPEPVQDATQWHDATPERAAPAVAATPPSPVSEPVKEIPHVPEIQAQEARQEVQGQEQAPAPVSQGEDAGTAAAGTLIDATQWRPIEEPTNDPQAQPPEPPVSAAAPVAPETVKEPWQMTRAEFLASHSFHTGSNKLATEGWRNVESAGYPDSVFVAPTPEETVGNGGASVNESTYAIRKVFPSKKMREAEFSPEEVNAAGFSAYVPADQAKNMHRYLVEQAIKEGKTASHPDYPDLSPSPPHVASERVKADTDSWNVRRGFNDARFFVGKDQVPFDVEMIRATDEYLSELPASSPERKLAAEFKTEAGESPHEIRFENIRTGYGEKNDKYGMTRTGNSHEVIRQVSALVAGAAKRFSPKMMYFTAEGESRNSLYKRLAKKAEGYTTFEVNMEGDGNSYAMVRNDSLEAFQRAVRSVGLEVKPIGTSAKSPAPAVAETKTIPTPPAVSVGASEARDSGGTPRGGEVTKAPEGVQAQPKKTDIPLGPGKANADSPEFSKSELTGIKNAETDKQRAAEGMAERPPVERKSDDVTLDNAIQKYAADPHSAQSLIDEMKENPRPHTDEEVALLLAHMTSLKNAKSRALRDRVAAEKSGDNEALNSIDQRLASLRKQTGELIDVVEKTGTQTSRGLRFRRNLLNDGYTLEEAEFDAAQAKGRDLTPEEAETLRKEHEALQKSKELADIEEAENHEKAATAAAEFHLGQLKAKAKADDTPAPIKKLAGRIREYLDTAEENLIKRIKARGTRVGMNDIAHLADEVALGSIQITKGLLDVGEWSAKMVKLLGDGIKPHLDKIWEASKTHAAKHEDRIFKRFAGGESEKVKAAVKAKPVDMLGKIGERQKGGAGLDELSPYIKALALEKVRGGISELPPLLDALHADLKKVFPNATREEVRDAMSGYGKVALPDPEAAKVTLRDLNQQAIKAAQLDALRKKEAPLATGPRRDAPSAKVQALTKEVNAKKRELGIVTTDPERQLKSTLDSMKTRVKNRRDLLQMEVDTGQRIVKGVPKKISDAELESLRTELAAVKKTHDDIFGKNTMSDEQKLKLATAAAESNQKMWQERLDKARKGQFDVSPKADKLTSPEIDAIRKQTEAAKAEFNELKEAANPPKSDSQKREDKLQKDIKAIEDKIAGGDLGPKPASTKNTTVDSAYITDLKTKRAALADKLAELRKNDPVLKAKAEVESATAAADEYERKTQAGEFGNPATAAKSNDPAAIAARDRLTTAKEAYNRARDADPAYVEAKNKASDAAYIRELTKRTADLADREARGDFAPRQTAPKARGADAVKAKTDYESKRQAWELKKKKWELDKRATWEKGLDTGAKVVRASVLSGPVTLVKLLSATVEQAAFKPLSEMAGTVISHTPGFRDLANKANLEGGNFNIKEYGRAVKSMMTQGLEDARRTLRDPSHKSELDILYGKPGLPQTALEAFGILHGAEKAPLKRFAFEYAKARLERSALAHNENIADPAVKDRIGRQAYAEAERTIFQEENRVTAATNAAIGRLEAKNKDGTTPVLGKVGATVARTLLPVAKVGTNVVAQTFEHIAGAEWGLAKLGWNARHMDRLTPEQANIIMRNLKRGSIGTAATLIGYFAPAIIQSIPKVLMHNPLLMAMQYGANAATTANSPTSKEDKTKQGLGEGLKDATTKLVRETPLVGEVVDEASLLNSREQDASIGRTIGGLVVPQALSQTARLTDKPFPFNPMQDPVARKPKGILQNIEMGIPGLRQQVPTKEDAKEGAKTPEQQRKDKMVARLRSGDASARDELGKDARYSPEDRRDILKRASYATDDDHKFDTGPKDGALEVLEKTPALAKKLIPGKTYTYWQSVNRRVNGNGWGLTMTRAEHDALNARLQALSH